MHVMNAFDSLSNKSDTGVDMSSKTILQQYLHVKDKYKLDLEDILSLVSDFIMAGVDTVCVRPWVELCRALTVWF
jgi:hypothetical protein